MTNLKLALDWTPNINHIGFFVAQEKGFYQALDLAVELLDPAVDNYQTTPAKKVELGLADFALCPTESMISYRTKIQPFPLIAVAALLQEDLSAITVLSDKGLKRPKDLDGKIYSSYQARYEDGIVREMIKNDGGAGNLNITYPAKLGIWNTLLSGEADATWIFLNWEGVEAAQSQHELTYFKLRDYHIPYSYSPVIAANADLVETKLLYYRRFLSATKKGYLYGKDHPSEAVEILRQFVPQHDQHIDLAQALEQSVPYFGDEDSWGRMEEAKMKQFLQWIQDKGLEQSQILPSELYTLVCLEPQNS
ncbi:MAG: ABC transporter substrate-binding protein [Bacteroidota bacterium]